MEFWKSAALAMVGAAISWAVPYASAQSPSFPSRPIRIIVPFPAGGPTDILARVVGQRMGEQVGQPVIIDNRPGANTVIGASAVAKAPPDGYTLLMAVDNTLAMNQFMYSKLAYDPVKDFEPVGKVAVSPLIVVTRSDGPKTLQALLAKAKSEPNKVNYGYGTFTTQFAGAMLRRETGDPIMGVPYKGSSAVTQGLLTRDVLFTIDGITAALPHIQKGTLRALAKLSDRHLAALPDLPTLGQLGVKMPDTEVWMALVAPKGTAAAVVDRLSKELNKALAAGDVQKKLADVGLLADGSGPDALRAFIAAESAKWKPVIESTGVRID